MPQIFLNRPEVRLGQVDVRGADARHIATVLRLGLGDRLMVCDGAGGRYRAEIVALRPLHITLRILQALPPLALSFAITLAVTVVRPERYEWLIEKAFELGCRRLLPLTTARTVAKYLPKRPQEKLTRWRQIALAAAKQSGLPWLPEVGEMTPLQVFLRARPTPLYYCWEGLHLGEKQPDVGIGLAVSPPAPAGSILIGPEGGFTAEEHRAILAHKPILCSLGPLILRTETAALTALTLIQQQMGYFQHTAAISFQ